MGRRGDHDSKGSRAITSQLLIDLQGARGICLVGATNTPWQIDPAFIRRFDRSFYISLPNKSARVTLLKQILDTIPNTLLRPDIERLAQATDGFSSDDIRRLCKNASGRKLHKLRNAEYFAQSLLGDWFPCTKNFPCAVPRAEIEQSEVNNALPPAVSGKDFELSMIEPACKRSEVEKFDKFISLHKSY